MKILYILPLLAASALHAVPEANALALDNGRNINGRNLNGGSLNGRNLNGLATNGLATNGRNLNGLATNGRNVNGLATSGMDREDAAGRATTVILKDGERASQE